jgi:hypothetical protein
MQAHQNLENGNSLSATLVCPQCMHIFTADELLGLHSEENLVRETVLVEHIMLIHWQKHFETDIS